MACWDIEDIEVLGEQFGKGMFLSDDSETDDESDMDYNSDRDIELERQRITPVGNRRGFHVDIINKMWNTVLHHGHGYRRDVGLASITCLVCTIDGVHKPIIYLSRENEHAEMHLLTHLKKNYNGPIKMTIYINNSPCVYCAKSIKQYLDQNVNIQLILYVTHLYYIKRKSCQLRKDAGKAELHIDYIKNKVHEDQYHGLRSLMSLGGNRCRIEAFTKEVWESLLAVMDMSEESRKRVKRVYGLKLENSDRSRQSEDRRIRKDLNHIKLHSDPWHDIKK